MTSYKTVTVEGLDIFYREAGSPDDPTILLLHGFPTSSHMFRNLVQVLSDRFHLVAPDYPGYGNSSMPSVEEYDYTFDSIAEIIDSFTEKLGLHKYSLYVMDYGAPVGYRLAVKHPERVESLIVQNGNAYEEGLREFWDPIKAYWKEKSKENGDVLRNSLLTIEATRWQYTNGVRNPETVAPENWFHDQYLMDRYGSNPPLYPDWQAYFREYQPPTLIAWGKNDYIFPEEGAHPYKRDLKNIEFHILDTGHFALEEDGDKIAHMITCFLAKHTEFLANHPEYREMCELAA
jgi:pimeloyl-ACP methyl ester carboxylesterase